MVKINGLSFGYNRNRLFDNLSLSLEPGNIYGLLGKNGAGKTTLLRILSGQIFPGEGECRAFDNNPGMRSPDFLSKVFFVPEEYSIPAIKCVEYEKMYSPFYPGFDRDMFYDFLKELEIDIEKNLSNLSFGQKKKYLLAFGMASQCPLFIMDEPTNGLDIPSKSQFRKLVASSIGEDRTFIISTHQVRDLENIIDPIVILDSGKIIFNEPLEVVSKLLSVKLQTEKPVGDDVIYYEQVMGGYSVIKENRGEPESNISLESLFNAALGAPEKINKLFGGDDYGTY